MTAQTKGYAADKPSGVDLRGGVAVITGAGSGIGWATALRVARCGGRVIAADIQAERADQVASEIAASGGDAVACHVDVTDADSCDRLVETTLRRFGRLDFAFNNAGIVDTSPSLTADTPVEAWNRLLAVNLTGVFQCMRSQLRAMRGGGGSIVNTSSIMGTRGTAGGAAYCASKHGVIGLTRAAALEYGRHGIRVNAVCPGYVATPMTTGDASVFSDTHISSAVHRSALKRLGEPVEIADMVAWLFSDNASYVTGAHFDVDGGLGAA
jgi:NAD(P)-dependent dehydrogenase (short-subunit alcohol dehydrogenase family)